MEEKIETEHSSAGRDGMEAKLEEKPKLRLYRTLKFDLEQEEYLNVIQDSEARRLMTALRGGTNMLAVEKDRWKHKDLKKGLAQCALMGALRTSCTFSWSAPHTNVSGARVISASAPQQTLTSERWKGNRLASTDDAGSWLPKHRQKTIHTERNSKVCRISDAEKELNFIFKIGLTRNRVVCCG